MENIIEKLSVQHQISRTAIQALWVALQQGNGRQAQFNHPELGGMGQWMPGMIMISDMNNHALKAKIDAICTELSPAASSTQPGLSMNTQQASWWAATLGTPSSSGSQNNIDYAYFPNHNCIAIRRSTTVTYYSTRGEQVTGVSAQNQQVFVELNGQRLRVEALPQLNL